MNIYLRGNEDFHACPNSRKQNKKMFDKAKFKFAKVKEYSLDSSIQFILPDEINSTAQAGNYVQQDPNALSVVLFVFSYIFFFTYYSIAALTNNLKIKLDKE